MDHSCANHFPCNLPPPINNSHSLITDREVNDWLGLRATFRHYLEFKHTSECLECGLEVTSFFPTFCTSNLTSSSSPSSWTAYPTSTQMQKKWKCCKWSIGFQKIVYTMNIMGQGKLTFFFNRHSWTWLGVYKQRLIRRGVYVCKGEMVNLIFCLQDHLHHVSWNQCHFLWNKSEWRKYLEGEKQKDNND